MNFVEYSPKPLNMGQNILLDLVNLCELFKIDRSLWDVVNIQPDGGFTLLSAKGSSHYVTVSFGENQIIFDGYSIDWVEFSTPDHDTEFFAAILAMFLAESNAEIVHTTPVEALQ